MGGGTKVAKQGNAIAQASLDEQKRQYAEQEAEKKRKKDAAQGNALGVRQGANASYSNNFTPSTDYTGGRGRYSLLASTESILGGNTKLNNKLG